MRVAVSSWQNQPVKPSLLTGQIDLWRFRLDRPVAEIALLEKTLSQDELQRAERLLITEKRQQFITARGCLRKILALYLRLEPAALSFCYGPFGKPSLLNQKTNIHFNLAHSGHWALLAVSGAGEVGVDLEMIDTGLDFLALARQFFTPDELNILNTAPAHRQRRIFYRLWTAKESKLKYAGSGFSTPSFSPSSSSCLQKKCLPIAKKHLATLTFSQEITSINRIQLADI